MRVWFSYLLVSGSRRQNKKKKKKRKEKKLLFLKCISFCGINTHTIVSFKLHTWCHWTEFKGNLNQFQCKVAFAHHCVRLIPQRSLECLKKKKKKHCRVIPLRGKRGCPISYQNQSVLKCGISWGKRHNLQRVSSPSAILRKKSVMNCDQPRDYSSWEISASTW